MNRGDDPAFPTNRAGHSPEPGMSLRDYVEIEILAKLYAEQFTMGQQAPAWCAKKAVEAADAWLAEREKRNAPKAQ